MILAGESGKAATAANQQLVSQAIIAKKQMTDNAALQQQLLDKQFKFWSKFVPLSLIGVAIVGVGIVMYARRERKKPNATAK